MGTEPLLISAAGLLGSALLLLSLVQVNPPPLHPRVLRDHEADTERA